MALTKDSVVNAIASMKYGDSDEQISAAQVFDRWKMEIDGWSLALELLSEEGSSDIHILSVAILENAVINQWYFIPPVSKKNFASDVLRLYEQGRTENDIAERLEFCITLIALQEYNWFLDVLCDVDSLVDETIVKRIGILSNVFRMVEESKILLSKQKMEIRFALIRRFELIFQIIQFISSKGFINPHLFNLIEDYFHWVPIDDMKDPECIFFLFRFPDQDQPIYDSIFRCLSSLILERYDIYEIGLSLSPLILSFALSLNSWEGEVEVFLLQFISEYGFSICRRIEDNSIGIETMLPEVFSDLEPSTLQYLDFSTINETLPAVYDRLLELPSAMEVRQIFWRMWNSVCTRIFIFQTVSTQDSFDYTIFFPNVWKIVNKLYEAVNQSEVESYSDSNDSRSCWTVIAKILGVLLYDYLALKPPSFSLLNVIGSIEGSLSQSEESSFLFNEISKAFVYIHAEYNLDFAINLCMAIAKCPYLLSYNNNALEIWFNVFENLIMDSNPSSIHYSIIAFLQISLERPFLFSCNGCSYLRTIFSHLDHFNNTFPKDDLGDLYKCLAIIIAECEDIDDAIHFSELLISFPINILRSLLSRQHLVAERVSLGLHLIKSISEVDNRKFSILSADFFPLMFNILEHFLNEAQTSESMLIDCLSLLSISLINQQNSCLLEMSEFVDICCMHPEHSSDILSSFTIIITLSLQFRQFVERIQRQILIPSIEHIDQLDDPIPVFRFVAALYSTILFDSRYMNFIYWGIGDNRTNVSKAASKCLLMLLLKMNKMDLHSFVRSNAVALIKFIVSILLDALHSSSISTLINIIFTIFDSNFESAFIIQIFGAAIRTECPYIDEDTVDNFVDLLEKKSKEFNALGEVILDFLVLAHRVSPVEVSRIAQPERHIKEQEKEAEDIRDVEDLMRNLSITN